MDPNTWEPWQEAKRKAGFDHYEADDWLTGPLADEWANCDCHAWLREIRAKWQATLAEEKALEAERRNDPKRRTDLKICPSCGRERCPHTHKVHEEMGWTCAGCPTDGACPKPEPRRKEGKTALVASLTIRIPEKQGRKNKQIREGLSQQLHNLADGLKAIPDAELLNWVLPIMVDGERAGEWRVDREGGQQSESYKLSKAYSELRKAETWLVGCPWCGERMGGMEVSSQMSHLISCGDERIAKAGALKDRLEEAGL